MREVLVFSGVAFLIFRFWLVEIKLPDELQFRKRYFSRILTYYGALTLIFELKNDLFNFIMLVAVPVLIVSIIGYDALFFIKFKRRTYWEKNHGWLIVERLTMHPPLLILGIWLYATGTVPQIDWIGAIGLMFGLLVVGCLPFFFVDERWTKKYLPKTAKDIIVGTSVSAFLTLIYLLFFL